MVGATSTKIRIYLNPISSKFAAAYICLNIHSK